MSDEWGIPEVVREMQRLAASVDRLTGQVVRKDVFEPVVKDIKDDVADLKDSRRSQATAIGGLLLTIIGGVILSLVTGA